MAAQQEKEEDDDEFWTPAYDTLLLSLLSEMAIWRQSSWTRWVPAVAICIRLETGVDPAGGSCGIAVEWFHLNILVSGCLCGALHCTISQLAGVSLAVQQLPFFPGFVVA